jgi:hypothetical protein
MIRDLVLHLLETYRYIKLAFKVKDIRMVFCFTLLVLRNYSFLLQKHCDSPGQLFSCVELKIRLVLTHGLVSQGFREVLGIMKISGHRENVTLSPLCVTVYNFFLLPTPFPFLR